MNWVRRFPRKALSHPARLSFPRMEPLEGSSLARLRASLRRRARFFRPVVLTISRLILVHDHVEHPVELVLDAPMAADDGVETFRREGLAEQIAAGLDRRSAVDLAGSGELSDRL